MSYYDLFCISPTASQREIEEKYRWMVASLHPDRHHSDEKKRLMAEEHLKKLNSARDILCDPVKRRAYDLSLHKEPDKETKVPPRPDETEKNRVYFSPSRHKFHRKGCEWLQNGGVYHYYPNRETALEHGLRPCRTCNP